MFCLYFFPTDELQSQFLQTKQVIQKSNFFLFSCEICCLTKSEQHWGANISVGNSSFTCTSPITKKDRLVSQPQSLFRRWVFDHLKLLLKEMLLYSKWQRFLSGYPKTFFCFNSRPRVWTVSHLCLQHQQFEMNEWIMQQWEPFFCIAYWRPAWLLFSTDSGLLSEMAQCFIPLSGSLESMQEHCACSHSASSFKTY